MQNKLSIALFFALIKTGYCVTDKNDIGKAIKLLMGESKQTAEPLGKSSAATQAYYKNTTFNFEYTAPIGWEFTPSQITEGVSGAGVHYDGNLAYPDIKSVYVSGFKRLSNGEADMVAYFLNYGAVNRSYSFAKTQAPLVYFSADTTVNGIHFVITKIKDLERNSMEVSYSCTRDLYTLNFAYLTTVSDFIANETSYLKIWNGLLFLQSTTAKMAATGFSRKPEFKSVNVLGQSVGNKELSSSIEYHLLRKVAPK
jgi:hypothetical protein